MKGIIFFISVWLLLIPAFSFAGTSYYVDPQAPGGGNGSYNKPWNSISQINNHQFNRGDDLYFKVNSHMLINTPLRIRWDGTASNRVIIGAYYGENQFGVPPGQKRPVLDGRFSYPEGNDYRAIIEYKNRAGGYVTVRDLHIKDSYSIGINMSYDHTNEGLYTQYNHVINCIIEGSGRQGILWARTSNGLIENNVLTWNNRRRVYNAAGNSRYSGASIEVTGVNRENVTLYNVIRGNTVSRAHESIGAYKGARYTTIENNTVFDFSAVGIYIANARDATISNNLIYQPNPLFRPSFGRGNGIHVDAEGHIANIIKVTGNVRIENNRIAGTSVGILLNNNSNHVGVYQKNTKIINNRLVDCDRNIRIANNVQGWEGNEISNNYSFIFTPGLVHIAGNTSASGVIWYGNHYNTPPNISGNAAKNAHFNNTFLMKESGWRNLVANEVNTSFFNFLNEKSDKVSDKVVERVTGVQIIPGALSN